MNDNIHKCGIYVIFNKITKKYYVGRTKCFRKRFLAHCKLLLSNKHPNKHLQSSFNKYTQDAFIFYIVDIIPKKLYKEFMEKRELYFINYFDSLNNGYNIANKSVGGDTYTHNPRKNEIIEKRKLYASLHKDEYSIRNSGKNNPMYGKHHSKETKQKMKEKFSNGSRAGKNNPMYGKHCSEERKMNIKRGQEKSRLKKKYPNLDINSIMNMVNKKYPLK